MSEYPRIDLTVDAVVFSYDAQHELSVLLIQRNNEPFKGTWAIPGGFVDDGEKLEDAVKRELLEETGVVLNNLKQFHTFGDPDRDPRKRIVSVAYYTLVDKSTIKIKAADDAADAQWFKINSLPVLAFDHAKILDMAISLT